MKRWGWTPGGMCVSKREQLQFVHFSDYDNLAEALREIRSLGPHELAGEIAEAALLSAGEEHYEPKEL